MEKQLSRTKNAKWEQSASWHLVHLPYLMPVFAAVLLALTLSFVGTLFLPWQQSSNGLGKVIAYSPDDRTQQIESPIEGRIARWHVGEGNQVRGGDKIVDLEDIDPNILGRLENELAAATQKLSAAEKAVEFSKRNLERQKSLASKGLSSQRAYELAELEYAKLVAELSSASAEVLRIQSRFSRQTAQSIVAPRDGVVQRIYMAQGGAIVHAGDLLATLVPLTTNRAVEAIIDGNDLPLLSKGRKVRVQFEGWPAVQFVGWPSVAVGTFGGIIGIIDESDNGAGKFRIIVFPDEDEAPWPDAKFLRQGVRTQVWVLLDTVKLGYELWRRFNGFPQSLSLPDAPAARSQKKNGKTSEDPRSQELK